METETLDLSLAENLTNRKSSLSLQLPLTDLVAEPLRFEPVCRIAWREIRYVAVCAYCDRTFAPELFGREKDLILRAFKSHDGPISPEHFARIAEFVMQGGAV